jgi:hypothetical protein
MNWLQMVGITCLFIACKSEECLRPIKNIIWSINGSETDPVTSNRTYPFGKSKTKPDRPAEIEDDTEAFVEMKDNIFKMERVILHVLGFDFMVEHPTGFFSFFLQWFDSMRREKEGRRLIVTDEDGKNPRASELGRQILQKTHAFANDWFATTLCLQVPFCRKCINLRHVG